MSNEERDFDDGYQLRLNIVDYMIKNSQFFIPKIKLVLQTDILTKKLMTKMIQKKLVK